MIAMVVSAIVDFRVAAAPRSAARTPPRNLAALIEASVRQHPGDVEIVRFADHRLAPVRVVRGGESAAATIRTARPERDPSDGTIEIVAFANPAEPPVTVLRGSSRPALGSGGITAADDGHFDLFDPASGAALDRVSFAVDGAESSHGTDPTMWRPDLAGPEGPMQVSAAAAIDSGGGDRFDFAQNRLLGRAYLAHLYRRYGNWPDAIAAYNWGPGNLDAWIVSGRPEAGLPPEVERYRNRVLRDGGMPPAPAMMPIDGEASGLATPGSTGK
ncbi:MAG: lytic transglycosylase domain-containing protein [Stellaceae bacterium]